MTDICHYCSSDKEELRPYGPNGAYVCFKCAMETPEREAEAREHFLVKLDAAKKAGNGVVFLGDKDGPRPAQPVLH